MTLTKCPHCGHTVLSVASQCPACSGNLMSTFLGLEHEGELAECRSCGRPVRSRTAVCPHCGVPSPARRRANARILVPILSAALVGLLAIALRDRTFQAADSGVSAPRRASADSAVPDLAFVRDSTALLSGGLQRKWTADWSNMRQAPHTESPIVRVLAPGTEVHAAPQKWGWWAILWKGDTVGYIAGALLRATRPGR